VKPKLFFLLLPIALPISAQITTDNTLAQHLNLPGPDYRISADLGQQHGSNLFYSFQEFNLQHFESATFSGPNHIQNIISRVTGGNPSNIDGTIRSTIPNADFYFLNPYGIMFGPNARLDVLGSFHVSTADYLRLGEDGRFDATVQVNTLLSVAPPTAFGFLDAPIEIKIQGSQLTVAPHADFSVIGGNLTLEHAQLLASSGRINLVSVASKGEVTAKASRLDARIPDTSSFALLGQIAMIESQIETSGSPAGGISIHGGQFWMFNALIHAHNFGDNDGKEINIELSDWMRQEGDTFVVSDHQDLDVSIDTEESFGIISDTYGTGKAGSISIIVPRLEIHQNTIDVSTRSEGEGGDIDIQTRQMYLGEGAEILSNSYGNGTGGQINIKATEQLELIDQRTFFTEEEVYKNRKTSIQTNTFGNGNSGQVHIEAGHITLSGGYVLSNTDSQGDGGTVIINGNFLEILNGSACAAAVLPQGVGDGGHIKLNVTEAIKVSGFRPGFTQDGTAIVYNLQSGIGSITLGKGNSGSTEILTKNLLISDSASVGAATVGVGYGGNLTIMTENLFLGSGGTLNGGSGAIVGGNIWKATGDSANLTVTAKNDIIIEGRNPSNPSAIMSNTFFSGQGGNIDVQANRFILRNGGTISANSLGGTGNAGNIHLRANKIHLSQGGKITSAASQAIGGNINITASTLFDLQGGQITTSVHGGKGDGGNIQIEYPAVVVMNNSQIIAQAYEGQGGNIHITSEHFIKSYDSIVNASSQLGLDGQVKINSLNENFTEGMLSLVSETVNASQMMEKSCEMRSVQAYKNRSHFIVNPITGSPTSPFDLQPSRLSQWKN